MRSVAFITSGYYPLYVCYAMENCLDLAIRTEGVVGNVAPTIDKNATCCTLGIHAEYVLGLLRGAWWTFVSYRAILSPALSLSFSRNYMRFSIKTFAFLLQN